VLVETDAGYALRFTDGSWRVIPGMPAECAAHVGARLWVIGWDENAPIEFGLIAAI
jgi:hypothetical protein